MKTRIFALICALTLFVSAVPSATALEGEALRAADTLATLNLVKGTGSGYALESPITRAQAAVLLVRLAGAEAAAAADTWDSGFQDIPAWAQEEISYAAHQGWIHGVTDSEFKPNEPLSANAWCAMLLRMLGYQDKANHFKVDDAAAFAQRIGLVSRSYTGTLSRGDVFEIMCDSLTFPSKDGNSTVIEHLIASGTCTHSAANALGLLNRELTAREVADRHMAAVFCLDVYEDQDAINEKVPSGNATGFFITPDGLAVTNYHSIDGGVYATATLSNGEVYEVKKVVYYNPAIDIAIIRVSQTSTARKTTSAFAYLDLAGTEDIRPGDVVYALSNPLGLGLAVSSGIISATGHEVERYYLPCIVNSADISQGSSGGALLNIYGQVIAVTSGAYAYGNNMYLAVPVDPAMKADWTYEGRTLEAVKLIEEARAEEAEEDSDS